MWKFAAIVELFRRYAATFSAAWAIRAQLRGVPRQSHELAFLPANLELAETPMHPAPHWAMRSIAVLALLVLAVATVGKLDIVVTARGKLTPTAKVKLVQPAVTGVVRRILVEDGQHVVAGQLLVELDPTQAAADNGKAHATKVVSALAAARAIALLEAQSRDQAPVLGQVKEASAKDLTDAQRFAEGIYREYREKVTAAHAELDATRHEIASLKATLPLAREQADDYRALVEDKYVAKHDYLDKQQSALQQEHELAAKISHAEQLEAGIAAQSAEFRREQLDALDKANQQFEQFRDEEEKATTREQLMTLTAPVDGTVEQLAVHTVGGVVTTAQSIMEIVPDDALEAEVSIENKDIGFTKAGQSAVVKIDAFPYTRFGFLNGVVRSISTDAAQDRRQGLTFVARIRVDRDTMQINGQSLKLTPGMTVNVEIKTGKRSVAGYFLDPLVRSVEESLRER
jgi:hemolysin D